VNVNHGISYGYGASRGKIVAFLATGPTVSNVVRLLVPFVITDEQLSKGLSILEQALSEISK
jgi:4-aminobutyrate aminotransferase-like enzyme